MDILQNLFAFLLTFSLTVCLYQLTFDHKLSPPLIIPLDEKDYIYSVPLNQVISRPIIAYIEFKNGSRVTHGPLSSETYIVSTIDQKTVHNPTYKDVWASSGGRLCQKGIWWKNYPYRLERNLYQVRCGSNISATTLQVQAFKGRIILDWLYHEHTVIPPNKRIFTVSFSQKLLKIYSNPFLVTAAAHHLTITQQPPLKIMANHDFKIIAEIRFQNDSIVDTGLDSVLNVDLTVPYHYKVFSNTPDYRMILKKTQYRLAGSNVILHQGNYDWLIRKRAVKGRVVFDGIRILDPGIELRLNLTMTMTRDPWLRVPNCAVCYGDTQLSSISSDGTEVTFREPDSKLLKTLQSVQFTQKFEVLEQTLYKLNFSAATYDSFQKLKDPVSNLIQVTRNTEITDSLTVMALDTHDRRIYAGSEATFLLIYRTIPASVCISADSTKQIEGGYGNIVLSFCQIIDNVTLEIMPNIRLNASISTPPMKVEGLLTISHLGDFRYSGGGDQIETHINSFIKFAAYDINNGYVLPFLSRHGFFLKVATYETKSEKYQAYLTMLNITRTVIPKYKSRIIISSTTSAITNAISPELWRLKLTFISTGNKEKHFSDKGKFPYFNRVCWAEHEILMSVFKACKDRKWTSLIIIKEKDLLLHDIFYYLSKILEIRIMGIIEVDVNSIMNDDDTNLQTEMAEIRSFRIKLCVLIARKTTQTYILRAAQKAKLDSLHGYQWILYSTYAWQFPFHNEGVCSLGIPCTEAFKSTYLFTEAYNITGYNTKDWIRVLGYYFSVDRFYYKGARVKYRNPEVGAKMALGYDAVLLYASVVQKIVSIRETLYGPTISKLARNMQINGLSGNFKLNSAGDRIGYFGYLLQVNPLGDIKNGMALSNILSFVRTLKINPDGTQLEIPFKSIRSDTDPKNPMVKTVVPVSPKYNLRIYESVSGVVDRITQSLTINPIEPWPSIIYIRKEKVTPLFYCQQNCGRSLLSVSDINVYDTGRCNIYGRCICAHGFHGNFCGIISCKCHFGICISSTRCSCYPGWMGLECNLAICEKCEHGTCKRPNVCECISKSYIGKHCGYHIAAVLIPLFIGTIITVAVILLLARYIVKHTERNSAFSNNDWLVDWTKVTPFFNENMTKVVTSQSQLSVGIHKYINTFLWKSEKWYGKKISSWTLDAGIPEFRLEMVDLIKIKHRNLITYAGASVIAPNVYLLLEVADKGSLNDILLNSTIDINWEFKFSFMRDICAGMKYLHVKMGSHGRLKSHNCLIDNRWTIRISGFGAQTIRFGRFRLPEATKEEATNLFWTAPELLNNATCLDDVKNGTVAGDTYSFSIVVAEILTRAEPYEYELSFFEQEDILHMIANNESMATTPAGKTWEEIGGVGMFICRPIIQNEFLPKSNIEKRQLVKMLSEAWNEHAPTRPTFEKLEKVLSQIHPVKGELIDNLISLLELYSNNLETIVAERTKELEISKARAEQLLSQMLPKKLTVELKKGRKVPPELFSTASVFFSDIVDFGNICYESSPIEIVDFLNETYHAFDDVLDYYDVYKVETISDSYMVVSGVPVKNGIKHASEVVTMALNLMSRVTTFQIPHRPKNTLQLRIGIHSGPLVAGVVGMLMPRYCLFGDTVNTASRMQTTSQALHIQISDSTAELLEQIGGFDLECRGQREVRGRGMMTTYWVWGKDDFDKPMPDHSLALSISNHTFK